MKRAGPCLVACLVAVICPFDALAQQSAPASPEFPKWDLSASWGLVFTNNSDTKALGGSDGVAWNVDAGRYFGTHLKADVGLMLNNTFSYGARTFRIEGLPRELSFLEYAYTTVRPISLSVAATYQFRDNELMHPYLSGGVRTVWQSVRAYRPATAATIRGVRYSIPAVDESEASLAVRPFVAAGFKSYFNRWVFMRSELLVAFGPSGHSHTTLRIGTGVDF